MKAFGFIGKDTSGQNQVVRALNSAGAGGGTTGAYTDFRVRLAGETEHKVTANVTKTGRIVTLTIPQLTPVFTATTTPLYSYICSHSDLQPAHLTGTFALSTPNDGTIVRWVGTPGSYYIHIEKGGAWTVGGSISAFSLTYEATNDAALTGGVWGTAYIAAASTLAYTSSGTWAVPAGVTSVSILIVAGGGGSGGTSGDVSAGGAGGLIYIPAWDCTGATSYTVTVGGGGGIKFRGNNSVVSGGSKTLTSLGGGHGGNSWNVDDGSNGGSGGSRWRNVTSFTGYLSTQPVNSGDGVNTYNTTGWGHQGGSSNDIEPGNPWGGGGGGAGSAGMNASAAAAGATLTDEKGNSLVGDTANSIGGAGKYYGDVFGTGYGESGYFASGGTTNGFSGSVGAASTKAHLGGGGMGNNLPATFQAASSGQVNTGGGAGSAGFGGSGIVLIKYA